MDSKRKHKKHLKMRSYWLKNIRMIIYGGLIMDFDNYINERMQNDSKKVEDFWSGYKDFKIGVLFKQ